MLPEEGIGVELDGEDVAAAMAAADRVGEEAPHGDLVAASPNWLRLLAPGGALVAARRRRVLGDHWGGREGGGGDCGRSGEVRSPRVELDRVRKGGREELGELIKGRGSSPTGE